MPLAGWLVKGQRISFEAALSEAEQTGHFNRFPASFLQSIVRNERKESRLVLSPSAAGGCARNRLLKITEDFWADPESYWAMFMGTSVHAGLEGTGDIEELKLEFMLKVPVTLPDGTSKLVEFPLSGTLDHYSKKAKRLTDYKTTSKPFIGFDPETKQRKARVLPEDSHVIQTNLYRLMLVSNGYPVEDIQLWYVQPVSGAPRKMVKAPLMELEDIYYTAVELALPYVYALETGELPKCTCKYKNKLEPDLCQSVTAAESWNVTKLNDKLSTNAFAKEMEVQNDPQKVS